MTNLKPHCDGINISGLGGGGVDILTIRKLQDFICTRHGNSEGESKKRKPKSSPGGHERVEGNAMQMLCEVNLSLKS